MEKVFSKAREHEKGFNIGHFVRSYDSLKTQLDEFNDVLHTTDSLRRWEVPPVTLLFCVFVITLWLSFPGMLLASCLFPIPLVFLATGIKNLGQGERKKIRNIVVMAMENDEQQLIRKNEEIAQATKDIQQFIKILCELQSWFEKVQKNLNLIQNLFYWDDPQLTLRFLGCIFALMLLLILVPLSLIILVIFVLVFFYNDAFNRVVVNYLMLLKVNGPDMKVDEVHTLDHMYDNDDGGDDVGNDHDDVDQSDHSSYDGDSSTSTEFEDIMLSSDTMVKERASRSIVSNLSKYRKLRQELNKGNCAACQVTFSSVLTRRKYCRRCGHDFCSKCCRHYVKKAALGATAPGARDKRVLVCNNCYARIRGPTKAPD